MPEYLSTDPQAGMSQTDYLSTDPSAGVPYLSTDPSAGLTGTPSQSTGNSNQGTDLGARNYQLAHQGFQQLPPEGSPEFMAEMKAQLGQDQPQLKPDPTTYGEAYKEGGLTGVALMPNKVTAAASAAGIPDLPPATNVGGKIVKGVLQFPGQAADFMTSPEGVELAAGTAVSGPVALATELGFTADQINSLVKSDSLESAIANVLGLATLGAGVAHSNIRTAAKIKADAEARAETQPPAPAPGPETAAPKEAQPPPIPAEYQGLPAGEPQTQRFAEPEGPEVPDEAKSTSRTTLDAVDWQKKLQQEQAELERSAKLEQAVAGSPTPYTARRLAEIDQELKRGYQPPEEPTRVETGDPGEDYFTVDDNGNKVKLDSQLTPDLADEANRAIKGEPPAKLEGDTSAEGDTGDAVQRPDEAATGESASVEGAQEAGAAQGSGASSSSPDKPGLANKYVEEDIKAGILPPDTMMHGKGWTPADARDFGRNWINKGGDPAKLVRALKGEIKWPAGIKDAGEAIAALHAERERLGAERLAAQGAENANFRDKGAAATARAAEQAEVNFLKNSKPVAGSVAQRAMVAFQEAHPVDLSTFDGLYRKAVEETGRSLTPAEKADMVRKSKASEGARRSEKQAGDRLQKQMDRTFPKRGVPTEADIAARIQEMVKAVTPCK